MKLKILKSAAAFLAIVLVTLSALIIFFSSKKSDFVPPSEKKQITGNPEIYLKKSESQFKDIRPDTEKKIIWANKNKLKTEYSIVYIHGFSASRQETSPLCELVAEKMNANLFYTRLSGHGRGSAPMGEVNTSDYIRDAIEAYEIGKLIGEKVIVIGMSTGGTLAIYLAMQEWTSEAMAYILISPNLGLASPVDQILTTPFSEKIIQFIVGNQFSWTPEDPLRQKYWTTSYPSVAIPRMMKLVKYVRESNLEKISSPLLLIYSKSDNVVNPVLTEKAFHRIGSKVKKTILVENRSEKEKHILAGRIANDKKTVQMAKNIADFIKSL